MEVRIANQFEQEPAFEARASKIDSAEKRRIAKGDAQLAIDGQNAFGHAGKNRLTAGGFVAQAIEQALQLDGDSGERAFEGGELVA